MEVRRRPSRTNGVRNLARLRPCRHKVGHPRLPHSPGRCVFAAEFELSVRFRYSESPDEHSGRRGHNKIHLQRVFGNSKCERLISLNETHVPQRTPTPRARRGSSSETSSLTNNHAGLLCFRRYHYRNTASCGITTKRFSAQFYRHTKHFARISQHPLVWFWD